MTWWRWVFPEPVPDDEKDVEETMTENKLTLDNPAEGFWLFTTALTSFMTWTLLWYGHWNESKWWKDWYCIKTFLEKWRSKKSDKNYNVFFSSYTEGVYFSCLPFHPLHFFHLMMISMNSKSSCCTFNNLPVCMCVSVFVWKPNNFLTRTIWDSFVWSSSSLSKYSSYRILCARLVWKRIAYPYMA